MVAQPGAGTILSSDLVNSTEAVRRASDEDAQRVFRTHQELLRDAAGVSTVIRRGGALAVPGDRYDGLDQARRGAPASDREMLAGQKAYPDRLTPREVDVLRLIARGRTNREIASDLTLSVRTVGRHVTNVYHKIDARNRAEAVDYAHRHDLS